MSKQLIHTKLAPDSLGDYSQAWTVTGAKIIFTAGQVSVDMDGNFVGIGDIALQTRTALENIKGILEGSGAKLQDVIKVTIYVTNMTEFLERTHEILREYFPQDFPASTLVEVRSLYSPEAMVEIEAIAAVG